MLRLIIILFREGEASALIDAAKRRAVGDCEGRGEGGGGSWLRDVPSKTIYRARYISLRFSLHVDLLYVRVCISPEAAPRAPRLDIRSARLFVRTTLVETVPTDGAYYIGTLCIWRRSCELPQVAITTSAIFSPGEPSAIKGARPPPRRATGCINPSRSIRPVLAPTDVHQPSQELINAVRSALKISRPAIMIRE